MSKKAGIVFLSLGVVLIVSALLLFLYNDYEDEKAGQSAEVLLNDVQAIISERVKEDVKPTFTPQPYATEQPRESASIQTTPQPTELPELTVVEIDGYGYIGILSIPDLKLQLPVMSDWDYSRLKISPCRHFGSSKTDDLVIAAHNYKTHFGSLSDLEIGAEICFTDMDGIENYYTLRKMETLAADAVDAVQNSGYDLVLYTCTPGGATRVVAFCDRVADETN